MTTAEHVLAIVQRLEVRVRVQTTRFCPACGCWLLAHETCPRCRAAHLPPPPTRRRISAGGAAALQAFLDGPVGR